ncbi:hypothetical protein D3C84_1265270 [compost metagenome]
MHGRERLYNLASGQLLSHGELGARLQELTGGRVDFAANARRRQFPKIDVSRVGREFGWCPRELLVDLPALLDSNAKRHQ